MHLLNGSLLKKLPYKSSFKRAQTLKIEEYNFIQNSKKWRLSPHSKCWMDNTVPENKRFSLILTFLKRETFQKFDCSNFCVFQFTKAIEKCGFKLKWKDLTHKYFYLMDFTKTEECKKKVPEFKLKACVYKKR